MQTFNSDGTPEIKAARPVRGWGEVIELAEDHATDSVAYLESGHPSGMSLAITERGFLEGLCEAALAVLGEEDEITKQLDRICGSLTLMFVEFRDRKLTENASPASAPPVAKERASDIPDREE